MPTGISLSHRQQKGKPPEARGADLSKDRLMIGIDATTGKHISGLAHLRQSVRDILTTPIGTRVMRRDYGSRLYRLVDAPMNAATRLDMVAATYEALETWEPRLDLESVSVGVSEPGNVVIDLVGRYLPTGETVNLDGLEVT